MDLPKSKHYGVSCAVCENTLWTTSQKDAELRLDVSFKDKGMNFIRTEFGIIIGFGRFAHLCISEETVMRHFVKEYKDRNDDER